MKKTLSYSVIAIVGLNMRFGNRRIVFLLSPAILQELGP